MEAESEWLFELTGGHLSLDFANTVSTRALNPVERLHSYADLISWSRQAKILTPSEAVALGEKGRARPGEAERTLERALALRESLFRIFSATVDGASPADADLEVLNRELRDSWKHRRLELIRGQLQFAWVDNPDVLHSMLWPIAQSAAELLTSETRGRVRVCEATASDECEWLFLDQTRNCSRRWCSMKDCGNRAKARRHYRRQKLGPATHKAPTDSKGKGAKGRFVAPPPQK